MTGMPSFAAATQHCPGSPKPAGRQQKEIEDNQNEKKEVKLSLFTDDKILHVKNPKDYTCARAHTHTLDN